MDAPLARFLNLPYELFLHVLEFSVVQDLNLLPHLQSCTDVRCTVVLQYHQNLGSIRSVCRSFDVIIRSSAVSLYCIALSSINPVPPARYPDLNAKLGNTLSLDIWGALPAEFIPVEVAARASQLTEHTGSLVRMSVSGNVYANEGPNFMGSMLGCMNNIQDVAFESISALLLVVPMDILAIIRATLDVRHLKAHHFITWTIEEPSVQWTRLESLDLTLTGNQDETLTTYLGADEYDRLRKITLTVVGDTTQISPLISRATSLTDLTILYDPTRAAIPGLPECDTLQRIRCFVNTGARLIQRQFPALDTVIMEGVRRQIHDNMRVPQTKRARFMDTFLVHLKTHEYAPVLRTVKISDFRTSDFADYAWFLDELSIYAYWGVHSQSDTLRFDFVDHEDQLILPSGFELGIRRMAVL